MTWDSSVCMGLYFAHNPLELKGEIIELGSGVGLGGILSTVAKELSPDADDVSLTCTDVNDEVLGMLEHNMDKAAESPGYFDNDNVHVKKLDWFAFVNNETTTEESKQYDTIIASDCAYLKSQVNPLSETTDKLLGKESKLHTFAPINRTVV
jgi:predicted nicotinamide N-methyase